APWVVRQHKHRAVIGRIVAPPPLPGVIGPVAAHRPKHVTTENKRADVLEAASGESVIHVRRAAVLADHLPECPRREKPFVQRLAADAEGLFTTLVRTGAIAIERDTEAMHAQAAAGGFAGRSRG